MVRDLTGVLQAWIEVGAPDAERLHRAAKAAANVTVYAHRGLDSLVARLDRRMSLDLTVSDHTLYVSLGDETLTGSIEERRLA